MTIQFLTECTLETTRCCVCGAMFAVEATFLDSARRTGTDFYCPNGHRLSYRDNREKVLERQLARERAAHDQTKAEGVAARSALAKSEVALALTKARVGKGVCPCCNRSFANLRRHMKGQHPGYGEAKP